MHSQAGEQQALRMSILYDTSLLISVAATYDEILAGISRHLKAVIPVDHAWLVAFSGQELHLVAASDKNCGVRPAREYFSEAHLRRVADQTENGIFAGKERIALVFDGRPAPPDLGALLVCPLQQGDNPEGYLLIGTGREDGYSRDDILLLFLLGLQLATVLRNIRLHNDLMAANSRLNLIFDNIEEGILLLDMEGNIQSGNPPVQERYFRDAPPATGSNFFSYLLDRKKLYRVGTWSGALRRIPERGAAAFPLSFELVRESGEHSEAMLVEILLIARDRDPAGMLVLLRDIGEMKKADELRKDLTAMLVHDLRSPLGIINWNMELMLEGVTGAVTPKQEKLLRGTIENSRELLEMVDSLLDIDRLETGSLTLDIEEFSLSGLVNSLIEHMEVLAGQMSLRFLLHAEAGPDTVRADRSLVRRILFNLLFNAAKYSPPGSEITITLSYQETEERFLVAVRDRGPGVLKQYRNLIFDKYVQVKARSRGELKSKGLGLTFCKLAVEAHHGSIWVEGEAGQGAVFCFTLPREYRAARS